MLINARPRIVSNGFETFVPTQRAESLHERLVEMTNNDVNAWSFFRPVAPSIEDWDRQFDNFNSNENYPVSRESGMISRPRMLTHSSSIIHTQDTIKRRHLFLKVHLSIYQRFLHMLPLSHIYISLTKDKYIRSRHIKIQPPK